MPRTQAAEDLRQARLEKAIENLLARYPYLIAPNLRRPSQQEKLTENDRVDLLFRNEDEVLVAEIKATPCGTAAVRQLVRYIEILSVSNSKVRGFLIGPRLTSAGRVALSSSSLDIRFLKLDVDVPTAVVVCAKCRLAYAARLDRCHRCESSEII